MRQVRIIGGIAVTALTVLSGCSRPSDAGLAEPPRSKPATLPVRLEGPTENTSILAGVSTRSGEMMILENDGTVTTTSIDSDLGRATLRQSEQDLFNLNDIMVADDSVALEDLPKPPRAQDIEIEKFAARRRSALPARITPTAPEAFLGNAVIPVRSRNGRTAADMVSVYVQVREGVDESAAFAYATCTLAAWSKSTNTPYGRHIRTLASERDGVRTVESIFTMSRNTPLGLRVMERDATLRDCRANGIPARLAAAGPVEGTEENG